ncbi:hypothetical protein CL6EHI_c00107 [Entamoeba histolytica]|uniref:Transcription factor pcc1 n=2 Tax=Entamoeba TaxID=5758 RepID=A0A175JND4_ENTHI|nr:hypothetical protein CL6EHI_c00107 [Entamoeba histolytica]
MSHILTAEITFPTEEIAKTVLRVVSVDKEFKKHEVTRNLIVEGNIMKIEYISNDLKLIRNGFNTLTEHIHLSLDTIKNFA